MAMDDPNPKVLKFDRLATRARRFAQELLQPSTPVADAKLVIQAFMVGTDAQAEHLRDLLLANGDRDATLAYAQQVVRDSEGNRDEPSASDDSDLSRERGVRLQFDTALVSDHDVLTVLLHGSGEPEIAEQTMAAIASAPQFRPRMPILVDALDTDYLPSREEAKSVPALLEAQLPGSRLALLVRPGPQYHIACMIEVLASLRHVPFAVFRTRDEAIQWLTVTPC
jgi:hypothetical protein